MYEKHALAPAGSTGNNTHNGVFLGSSYEAVVLKFVAEVVGTTVTWKVQATADDPSVIDANAAWFDVAYITDASDTLSVATRVRTTVGADIAFLSNPVARRYQRFRLVTSANTGVTYRGEIYRVAA